MKPEDLNLGLEFAILYDLSSRECEVLQQFLCSPLTIPTLMDKIGITKTTAHYTVKELVWKKVLLKKPVKAGRAYVYEFNQELLE